MASLHFCESFYFDSQETEVLSAIEPVVQFAVMLGGITFSFLFSSLEDL